MRKNKHYKPFNLSEKLGAEALGISKLTMYELRRKGCPWLSIGGKIFYYEPDFMKWILKNLGSVADV